MFRNWPIKRKIIGSGLLTSGTVLALMSAALLTYELVTFRQSMVAHLSTLARVIGANSTAALAFRNAGDAADILSALSAEPNVVAAGLYDNTGLLFATYPAGVAVERLPKHPEPDGARFSRASLVLYQAANNGDRRLGTLYLQSDLGALYQRLKLYAALLGSVVSLSCLVAFVLSTHLQRHISRPVLALVHTATVVAEQRDYSVRAARFGQDELGRLTDAFNEMLAQIQAQDVVLRTREEHLRREIADREMAEAEIQALNASLEQRVHDRTHALQTANAELETFSYTVSHDLRAPLRHIHGYGELLQRAIADAPVSGTARRYVSTMIAASADMAVLIDNLLEFSRMGRADMRTSEVHLNDVVREVVQDLEMTIGARRVEWQVAPLPSVLGDPAMVKQIISNLLGNAVKYTGTRDTARIEIGCAGTEGGRAIVFVRDNGAGFDPRYADKLFGVFQRLHRAEEFEGTGIGLATVRRIANRHGGRVWAEGALDRGATFYFTLALAASSIHLGEGATATCPP